MAINKVIYGNTTLIDLTSDTVTASDVSNGITFHLADGSIDTGTAVQATATVSGTTLTLTDGFPVSV